jgi:hypothetical protein
MARQRRSLLGLPGRAEPPELWLLKVASLPATCPVCGLTIAPGQPEAWHSLSTRYFHLACADLPVREPPVERRTARWSSDLPPPSPRPLAFPR